MPDFRLKHIRTMTFAYWMSFISTIFGTFFGLLFAPISYINFGLQYGFRYIILWIIITPIVFGIIGLFGSLVSAMIYNLFVRRRGGMFFEFEDVESKVELPPPPPSF